jgi:Flp pilus assembly pilin Flp
MTQWVTTLERLMLRDQGQDLLEYGLLIGLIAIVAMAGMATVGNTMYTLFWSSIAQAV